MEGGFRLSEDWKGKYLRGIRVAGDGFQPRRRCPLEYSGERRVLPSGKQNGLRDVPS
jgi:hypothetical protein